MCRILKLVWLLYNKSQGSANVGPVLLFEDSTWHIFLNKRLCVTLSLTPQIILCICLLREAIALINALAPVTNLLMYGEMET